MYIPERMQFDYSGGGLSAPTSHSEQSVDSLNTGFTGKAGMTTTTAMQPSTVYNTARGMMNNHLQSIPSQTHDAKHVDSHLVPNKSSSSRVEKQNDAVGGSNNVNEERKTASIDEGSGDGEKNDNVNNESGSTMTTTRTKKQRTIARVQFLALCLTLFLAGWNDGSTGPLLPRIQGVYKVCRISSSSRVVLCK